jgi:hypothetical protein
MDRPRNNLATWFEVQLVEDGPPPEARQRLERVVRREGHRLLDVENGDRPPFLAVGILADAPARELVRLMRLAKVLGSGQAVDAW